MIFLKILAFIVVCFNLYLLTISKKKNKLVLFDIGEKIQKIHTLVKFKNTEKVRTQFIHDIGRTIQRVRIFAIFHLVITIAYRIALCIMVFFHPLVSFYFILFYLALWSEGFSYELNINRITNPFYKLAKIIEIILLLVIIYG